MALGHLLNDTARPVGEVFADLERRRKDRAESISAVARSNDARSLKSLGPFGCWMRDRAFRWLAPLIARGLEKQYSAQVT
jgi:2-polyprenyl-6-methoxyphenol hydroxylase-like FAD-dependent oxidoreductase